MFKRSIYNRVKNEMDNYVIPIIVGHRRVGKTTLLKQLASEYENSLYLSFDKIKYRKMTDEELVVFFENEVKSGTKVFLIDEIQQIETWDLLLKELFDEFMYDKKIKIVVTGSSSLNFDDKETGVDRTTKILMGTLAYDEYLALTGKEKNFDTFEHFLTYGAFPQYLSEDIDIDTLLDKTLNQILGNDIPKQYGIKMGALDKLINELAQLSNGEFNKENSSRNLGIKSDTIENYILILEKCQIIKKVYRVNEKFELGKYPKYKIYINPHFHIWLLGKEFSFLDNKFKGHIIEAYWLFANNHVHGLKYKYFYLKNNLNEEIDFVTKDRASKNNFHTLIEFKYENNASSNLFHLLKTTASSRKIVYCKENLIDGQINFKNILDLDEDDKKI